MISPDDSLDLRSVARTHPSLIAVVEESRAYSYAEVAALVELRLSSWTDDAVLSIVCRPNLEGLVNFYAALARSGPTLLIHPRWSQEQTEFHQTQVGAECLIDGTLRKELQPRNARELHPQALLLLATSGSSGTPRIVQHSRSSLVAAAQLSSQNLALEAHDRWLLSIPFSHVGGVSILVRCLRARVPVVLATGTFSDLGFLHALEQQKVTLYSLVPTQLHDLIYVKTQCSDVVRSARVLLVGGGPASLTLRKAAYHAQLPVLFTYGMTEAGSQVSTQRPGHQISEPSECDVGYPLVGCELRLDENSRIHIRGPNLMLGYVGATGLSEQTSEVSYAPTNHVWFATSDRGELLADGRLKIHGRIDHVIISGGENIHPEQVEEQLGRCLAVEEVAVFGLPDPRWGQKVVALIVASENGAQEAAQDQVRSFAREHLPSYAVPKEYVFVATLPTLATGKLNRQAFPDVYWSVIAAESAQPALV